MKKPITSLIISSLTILLCLSLGSCGEKKSVKEPKESLMETERKYSALSAEKGMNTAFLAMFDSSGVILRKNQMPVEGLSKIARLLSSEEDTSFTLTWEPVHAELSASGDLGYTYGTYLIKARESGQKLGDGTYATVWKKNSKGEWKAMLDTGNAGLGSR